MSLKSDGKQFLLNIKPKYRKSVTPILQMLKENREASDFVCQAILEKVSRDGITSIESQVEVLLGGKAENFTPRSISNLATNVERNIEKTLKTPSSASSEQKETEIKEQEVSEQAKVIEERKEVQSPSTNSVSNQEKIVTEEKNNDTIKATVNGKEVDVDEVKVKKETPLGIGANFFNSEE